MKPFERCKQIARLNGWALRLEWNWSTDGCYASFVARGEQAETLIMAYDSTEVRVLRRLLDNYCRHVEYMAAQLSAKTENIP